MSATVNDTSLFHVDVARVGRTKPGDVITPTRPFGGMLIDFPLDYPQFRTAANGSAKTRMKTMPQENLLAIAPAIKSIADPKGCAVACWATGPKIFEIGDVLRAAGYTHKAMVGWIKGIPGKFSDEEICAALSQGSLAEMVQNSGIGIRFGGIMEYVCFGHIGPEANQFYTVDGTGVLRASGARAGHEKKKFTRLIPRPLGLLIGPRECPVFYQTGMPRGFWEDIQLETIFAPGVKGKTGGNEHSKKPLALHAYLECFKGDLVEIFARRHPLSFFPEERRTRWTGYGIETGVEITPAGLVACEPVLDVTRS